MLKTYSGVILAHGADSDNQLDIPGSNLQGVESARHFVNWYNGHPDYVGISDDETFNLSKVQDVVVVGQGNVALDCARILTKSVDELEVSDITSKAVQTLKSSRVNAVTVLGRRGHVQSAFTIKEFRELSRLDGVGLHVLPSDIAAGLTAASQTELENNRPKKRIVELIQSVAAATRKDGDRKAISVRFLLSPVAFLGDEQGKLCGIKVQRNRLEGEPTSQRAVPLEEEATVIPCQLVLQSIGYKCRPLSERLPFNRRSNTMPHSQGRVLNAHVARLGGAEERFACISTSGAEVVRGLYVAGWLKRGPTGIVGSNINDAKETVASVLSDLKAGLLASDTHDPAPQLLSAGGCIGEHRAVDWAGHLRIDAEELRRGREAHPPKEREKLLLRDEMLRVAAAAEE